MIVKIIFTVLFVLMLSFAGCWALMNFDQKRETFWFKCAQVSGVLMILIMVGSVLVDIWMN